MIFCFIQCSKDSGCAYPTWTLEVAKSTEQIAVIVYRVFIIGNNGIVDIPCIWCDFPRLISRIESYQSRLIFESLKIECDWYFWVLSHYEYRLTISLKRLNHNTRLRTIDNSKYFKHYCGLLHWSCSLLSHLAFKTQFLLKILPKL